MPISLDLTLRQEQRLSTQMLQTIETIAMSAEELSERIEKEAEKNPVLIVSERKPLYRLGGEDKEGGWIEDLITGKEGLAEHLLSELGEIEMEMLTRKAAEMLITAMDRNGFLPEDREALLSPDCRSHAEAAMRVIRSLEPPGLGASSWRESLIFQAEEKGVKGDELSLFSELIRNHLDQLRLGKYQEVASKLRTDAGEVEELYAFLKTLTPFPGRKYSSDYDEYITPELSIKKEDGRLQMRVNHDALPSVSLDLEYIELADSLKGDKSQEGKDARKFLKENIASAENLLNQIEMRASMLEKVGAVLMEKQKAFFLDGPLYLKALTIKETADEIGVHETTVGRIAASKYVDTDWGVYHIRDLFSSGVQSSSGDNVSRNAVKEMIQKIIAENSSGKALSDQKISDRLAEQGVKVARRTVSKYRRELDIESSYDR